MNEWLDWDNVSPIIEGYQSVIDAEVKSDNKKLYVVVVGEPCFVCGTEKAFLRSSEIYATKFIFEAGTLVSMERIVNGI